MSHFFIGRPIFAAVLSIAIVLTGGIALSTLPVAQYPEIAPPTVEVSAVYPGANARVVADTVASPIEQQVNGVEKMLYMSSQCTNDGVYTLTATFEPGADLNIAQVLVQNRVSMAEPVLPDLVRRRGISVKKKSPNILMMVNLFTTEQSGDPAATNLFLSNYATIQIADGLKRIPGVGDVTYLGQRDYSMRLWLDPQKLQAVGLTPQDVIAAVNEQNIQVAAGQIGQQPTPSGQVFQYTMTTLGRLETPEQFGEIVLKRGLDGTLVYMRDVARIELGALSYDQSCTLNGRPSVALSVYQLPGSNALEVSGRVKAKMEELREHFPAGIDYAIVYDTTPFINESIREVFRTLIEAVVLVAAVVLLFLQSWRAAIIPLAAVPVAVVGTFAALTCAGFSLNTLTLFGLVLAIGIVVDDAIVVVEAVQHHVDHGMTPRDAAARAMSEVSGPVVAVGLVLSAVFIPCAFLGGVTGQFFRQFAVTIAVSTLLSAFNSLTLSPALAALLLRPQRGHRAEALPQIGYLALGAGLGVAAAMRWPVAVGELVGMAVPAWGWIAVGALAGAIVGRLLARPVDALLGWVFGAFNHWFDRGTNWYTRIVAGLLRVTPIVLLVYGGLLGLTYTTFTRTPTGFIPAQDKGYLLVDIRLPDASSAQRTAEVVRRVEAAARSAPGVKDAIAVSGQSLLQNAAAPNFGSLYLMLDPFDQRRTPDLSADAIVSALQERLRAEVPDAVLAVFGAPPVEGLGTAGGFKIIVEDRSAGDLVNLQTAADRVVATATNDPALQRVSTSFRADVPWLELVIDRAQAKDRGVSIDSIRTTIEASLGPYYVNDFNRFGRTWKVNVQARDVYRQDTAAIGQLKVRGAGGGMVPLGSLASVRPTSGPVLVMRYNMYQSAAINADAAPGSSSGEALARLSGTARSGLPPAMRAEWTELALLQLQAGDTAMWVFLLAVVLVFLVLAAQYESWALPLAVILVVPMCLLCALVGVLMARLDMNIFTQIGFVVLIGLACKNAILIVEFAKQKREEGLDRRAATLAACQLRLRPIVMTSIAFILGVAPLLVAEGAGAEMRRALGTAVFAGMIGVTAFGIFLTPVFYFAIQWFVDQRSSSVLTAPDGEVESSNALQSV
ncbi:Efflux pump membrane transporter BepG [Gemmata sp. SH-PL17]|uniref:efflux RND transporter permease subunit n=1 Tax=Gemmata sp. SH-PL17 TaxID=1630693 RepID=UPI00078BCC0B|nr:multidrug efflux RND transporter permease subunit [Gemmata sp. SH-PL17]AMV28549.1 Efflux pump membrane transporter BepG [Gemmata sp. SH-PL17]